MHKRYNTYMIVRSVDIEHSQISTDLLFAGIFIFDKNLQYFLADD